MTNAPWPALLDQLLAGMSHALNNRVATLRAVTGLLQVDGTAPPRLVELLAGEVAAMERATMVLRTLPTGPAAAPIPLVPRPLMEEAVALCREHSLLGDVAFELEVEPTVPAMLAPDGALLRALLAVMAATGAGALRSGERHVALFARAAGPVVLLGCAASESVVLEADDDALGALARDAGAELARPAPGTLALRVPELTAARTAAAPG